MFEGIKFKIQSFILHSMNNVTVQNFHFHKFRKDFLQHKIQEESILKDLDSLNH